MIFPFFCADEHMVNTFFIELNGSITGACRRGRTTKDCTNHPTSTSILSNSVVNASLGLPLIPAEFKEPNFRCRIALDSRRQMVGCSQFLFFLSYWTAKHCSGFHWNNNLRGYFEVQTWKNWPEKERFGSNTSSVSERLQLNYDDPRTPHHESFESWHFWKDLSLWFHWNSISNSTFK